MICVDEDTRKIEVLNRGETPIYEPGLQSLMARNVDAGRLRFTQDLAAALDGADAVFIAVGTPTRRGDGHADLTFVMAADEEIARTAKLMSEVYRPLYLRDFPIVTTDLESAEMIKYAASAFLATKLTFINEIAALCEKVGADVKQVSKGMGLDGRIGKTFLHAGPGYGGSCFPKDTRALARIGQEHGQPMRITESVIEVNEEIKRRMIEKLRDLCDNSFNGKRVAVLGATFKPNTDDMREAPSLTIIPALVGGGAIVSITDPQGLREGEALLPGVTWIEDAYRAAEGADLLVILTEWNEFRALDLSRLADGMRTAHMADLRNIYSAEDAKRAGFKRYDSVGRRQWALQ